MLNAKDFWNNINNYFLQRKIDKMESNNKTEQLLKENGEKVIENLNGISPNEIEIDNAQSWCAETGHTNGPSDSFAVKSFSWKDGIYNLEYRNGGTKTGTCTADEAENFTEAESKGRAQRSL